MRRVAVFILASALFLAACSTATPTPAPTPTVPPPTPTPTPLPLGAGFRYSTYGPGYDPGPAYWAGVGEQMAGRFDGAVPETVWIVANLASPGTIFTFPGSSKDLNIHFSMKDNNEEALTLFDQKGYRVWLQVESGNAPVEELIHIALNKYGHHPSVVGVGVDVEWYNSTSEPEGEAVTDELARKWVAAARSHNPAYRVFLKHWEQGKMPPTERDGLLFVDDSQMFDSLDQMVKEFKAWGEAFAPAPVAFQFGYPADAAWSKELSDPPKIIGDALRKEVPNLQALYWVDFTALEVFPPQR